MKYRVVHCGTGDSGRHGLRGIINHPELELVGLYVNTPSKIGADAGDLCDGPKTGILGTGDIEEILDLGADCMSYMPGGTGRADAAIDDIVRFLERGTNVATISLTAYVNPGAAPAEGAQRLRDACARGRSTFFDTGVHPGITTWGLAAVALSAADEVTEVRIQTLFDFNHYHNAFILHDFMGFGQDPSYDAPMARPHVRPQGGFLYGLADSLGVHVDEVRLTHQSRVTEHPIDTCLGTIDAGLVAALKYEATAYVDGHPLIVEQNVIRLADDAAPDWPRAVPGANCYRVTVDGSPPFSVEWLFDRNDPEGGVGAEHGAAMHAVNAIPNLIAAAPGYVSWADLGMYTTRNVRLAPRRIPNRKPRSPSPVGSPEYR